MTTRSKRASSVAILLPFLLAPVLPDGTLDVGDRAHGCHAYATAVSAPVPDPDPITVDRVVYVGTVRSQESVAATALDRGASLSTAPVVQEATLATALDRGSFAATVVARDGVW